jgi:ABC-type uncharacterized transport system substrate-binding protein
LARFAAAGMVCCMAWSGPVWAAPAIDVLVSEPAGIYQQAATSLSQALSRGNWTFTVSTPERETANRSDLTVAIGTRALEAALARPGRPVLSVLVPRLTYERLTAGRRQVSALYLDQPLSRQLLLLNLALPGLTRAGVPLGPTSQGLLTPLQNAAKETGIQVNTALLRQGSDLHAAMASLAEDSQAFVLLPDPVVAQRSTLQSFLLHTYRLKKPVLAYSEPLAQSGALLALYATPAQLGEEAAGWIAESWGNGAFHLGPPRYPRRFTVGINRAVARSLELAVPSKDVLTRLLGGTP